MAPTRLRSRSIEPLKLKLPATATMSFDFEAGGHPVHGGGCHLPCSRSRPCQIAIVGAVSGAGYAGMAATAHGGWGSAACADAVATKTKIKTKQNILWRIRS